MKETVRDGSDRKIRSGRGTRYNKSKKTKIRCLEDVRGRMMEDIVSLDRIRTLPRSVEK